MIPYVVPILWYFEFSTEHESVRKKYHGCNMMDAKKPHNRVEALNEELQLDFTSRHKTPEKCEFVMESLLLTQP